jgi:hypothetical protein
MVEATGAEDVIAADTDHEAAIENEPVAASALLRGGEQVILHFPDHDFLQFCR